MSHFILESTFSFLCFILICLYFDLLPFPFQEHSPSSENSEPEQSEPEIYYELTTPLTTPQSFEVKEVWVDDYLQIPQPEQQPQPQQNLKSLKVKDLKFMARKFKIKGYSQMKKQDLILALENIPIPSS